MDVLRPAKLLAAVSAVAPPVLTYLICSVPRRSASLHRSLIKPQPHLRAHPWWRKSISSILFENQKKKVPENRYLFLLELPSRFEPDLVLTIDVLLSKTFPLLRHAAPLRCSRISYAPLLGPRLPCIARFLLRRLCPAERPRVCIGVSICPGAGAYQKKYLRTFVGGISFGAPNQSRTDDLILTMDALCQLSYGSRY
jgi:hypothetical protein